MLLGENADAPAFLPRPRRGVARDNDFHRTRHFLPQTVDTTKASRHKATRKPPLENKSGSWFCRVPDGAVLSVVTGGVPEWLKGTDCKSVSLAYVGSNPTSSTTAGTERLMHKPKPELVLVWLVHRLKCYGGSSAFRMHGTVICAGIAQW